MSLWQWWRIGWKGHEQKENSQLEGFGHHKKLRFASEGWEEMNQLGIHTRTESSGLRWGMWDGMEVIRIALGLW